MKQRKFYQKMLCIVLVMLLAAAVLTMTGCAKKTAEAQNETAQAPEQSDAQIQIGTGSKTFYFEVTDKDGGTSSYAVHTDADSVGQALLDLKIIDGSDSDYGLYVTTVNGQTLDWDADQMYWAFYENGEYASAGVDQTPITEGATYAFVATAG